MADVRVIRGTVKHGKDEYLTGEIIRDVDEETFARLCLGEEIICKQVVPELEEEEEEEEKEPEGDVPEPEGEGLEPEAQAEPEAEQEPEGKARGKRKAPEDAQQAAAEGGPNTSMED